MTLDRLLGLVREARHGTIALAQGLATLLALGVLPAPYDRWAAMAIAVLAAAGIVAVPNSKPTPLPLDLNLSRQPDWTWMPVQQVATGPAVSPRSLEEHLMDTSAPADETEPRTLP